MLALNKPRMKFAMFHAVQEIQDKFHSVFQIKRTITHLVFVDDLLPVVSQWIEFPLLSSDLFLAKLFCCHSVQLAQAVVFILSELKGYRRTEIQ
jgi:hypothetical protein